MTIINWCNDNQGFASAVLACISVVVSLYALFTSTRVQKKIHNRDVKLTLQQKVLEIYNAFNDSLRIMKFYDSLLILKGGCLDKIVEQKNKVLEHRIVIRRTLDEAHLFFVDDEPLRCMLCELVNDFMSLGERFIELTQQAQNRSKEVLIKVLNAFPELDPKNPNDIAKIFMHPQATKMFETLNTTPETQQFDEDLKTFHDKFSIENFDKRFEKYLIRGKLQ